MKRRENECCDCGLPCMGSSCPNRNVLRLYCDKCGHEVSDLYEHDGEELCEDCLEKEVHAVRCDKCGDEEVLFEHEGKMLCWLCYLDALRVDDTE